MNAATALGRMYPVKDMSRGKASAILAAVEDRLPVFILKNNAPYRVVITPEEYARFVEAEEALARAKAVEWAAGKDWSSPEEMFEHVDVYRRLQEGSAEQALSGDQLKAAASAIARETADLADEAFDERR